MSKIYLFFYSCMFFFLVGCTSYQSRISKSRSLIRSGQISEAITELKSLAEDKSDDQLVYLLDYATALQLNRNYKESQDGFIKADRLAEVQDYHSISNIAGSLIVNEGMMQYKGEPYENILINAVNAMNFLAVGDLDGAMVEVRRMNEKFTRYRMDSQLDFEKKSVFAKYLSGIIYEANRNWDDAFISYSEAYKIDSNMDYLKSDLDRVGIKAKRTEDVSALVRSKLAPGKGLLAAFSSEEEKKKNWGEVIVLVQQGWAPEKRAHPHNPRFPYLYRVYSATERVNVEVDAASSSRITTMPIYDVGLVALETMNDYYDTLVLKKVGGIVAKAVVSDQIRQKNRLLGELAWIALNISDVADTRQWSSLPNTFQVARIWLPPGKHSILLRGTELYGSPTGEEYRAEVEVKTDKKAFIVWRTLH